MSDRPMSIAEAVEAMKILGPRMAEVKKQSALSFVRTLLASMAKDNPVDALRLLSLMRHETLGATAAAMKEIGMQGFLVALFDGLQLNRVADLIEAAAILGLSPKGWADA
jgi:hypothetical protein